MKEEKKYMILEKIIYIIIFLLIISIAMILIIGNKKKLTNLVKKYWNEDTTVNYSEDFSIESLKKEALRVAIKENSKDLTVLVNKDNLIDESYTPDLVEPNVPLVGVKGEEKNKVNRKIIKDLEAMFNDAKKDGVTDMLLNSAYRSYENQRGIYNNELTSKNNVDSNLVAKPGSSEHQTGLAVDLTTKSINFDIGVEFENTDAFKWLSENAYKYGFILRYPKDKSDITKYQYEPWHYRYVGDKDLSTYIHENNLTLEEVHK